jgi:hypothetical protein
MQQFQMDELSDGRVPGTLQVSSSVMLLLTNFMKRSTSVVGSPVACQRSYP